MLLVIDIGNTNMEFGLFEGRELRHSFRLGTRHDITSDEIGLSVRQYLMVQDIDPRQLEDVVVTSVVPQVVYSVNNAVRKYLDKKALWVGADIPINLPNRYQNPQEVGTDRLVGALGAYRTYGGPLVVVDFGTATTFNAIDRDGGYLGGAIMPGVQISMKALFDRAAKLPRVELVDPGVVIGKTTTQSMQAGMFYGYSGAVMNIAGLMKQELGEDTRVVVTGGLSGMLSRGVAGIDAIDKSLTITGLRYAYEDYKAGLAQQPNLPQEE